MAHPDDAAAPQTPDWLLLTDASRPNGLLIGSGPIADAILTALRPSLRHPIVRWPEDRAPWTARQPVGTLILRDVTALAPHECGALLAWMDEAGVGVQVISMAPRPVYPLVQQQTFPDSLYYRLNQVCVDCSHATAA
jgi:hypothetical protein